MSDIPLYEGPEDAETDPRFPSGPWKGFFLDKRLAERRWMELDLVFKQGRVAGRGRDYVGKFVFSGAYDLQLGKCRFKKGYIGGHAGKYDGYNDGRGVWGVWSIPTDNLNGGFHIWPVGLPDPSGSTLNEYLDIPADPAELELVGVGIGEETSVGAGDRL
jgi:hypothetical protein